MAFFTEQMESLTNELLTSRQERDAYVTDVQEQAHKVLADARTFMHVLIQEHGCMTEQLRTELAADVKERQGEVKAQREQNRKNSQSMRKALLEMLAQTRRQCKEHVAELRVECHTTQKDLSADLRQAAKVWQRTFQACATTNGAKKDKVTVTTGATVTQALPAVKAQEPGKRQDHSGGHAAEAKKPTPAATSSAPPVKAEEPGQRHEQGRFTMAEPKKPTPATPPVPEAPHGGQQDKAKEPGHPHSTGS